MFRFCCGRILLASAYYKILKSQARLFKKQDARQSKIHTEIINTFNCIHKSDH